MRRRAAFASLLILVLLACQAVTRPISGLLNRAPTLTPVGSLIPTETSQPASPTSRPSPSVESSSSPSPAHTPSPGAPTATLVSGEDFRVRYHPDGGLYVGDQVSLEVIAPPGLDLDEAQVQVKVEEAEVELAPAKFDAYGIAGRSQATLRWAWDTAGLEPGDYHLDFSVQPAGIRWSETVSLAPAEVAPSPLAQARWATTETDCCIVYYITGTAVERDLPELEEMIDAQAEDAASRMDTGFEEAIPIVFISRVLGHGGFANNAVSISYLDRNYAGSSPSLVLHHELVHILDSRLGGELRPTLFVEGLAVYLSGGHFKPEALMPRAAALLEAGRYQPLISLADSFYPAQHETAYLEGASLIEFMVMEWGWPAFSAFYRDIHPAADRQQSTAIDAALKEHFDLSFPELEERFLEALRSIPVTDELREDVHLTVNYYDTVRRYQVALDPSAYYATAWLPDSEEMRKRGIVADYLRHPATAENLALEALLVAADLHLRAGEYELTGRLLQAANVALEAVEAGGSASLRAIPLAGDYLGIVQALLSQGYEAQRIEVAGDNARAWATIAGSPALHELTLIRQEEVWVISPD